MPKKRPSVFLCSAPRGEIGIRMALGASRGRVIGIMLRDASTMLLIGLAAGTGLALFAGRRASTMLFGLMHGMQRRWQCSDPARPHNTRVEPASSVKGSERRSDCLHPRRIADR